MIHRMRVLISGAGGLVGTALAVRLRTAGHEITALTRGGGGEGRVAWNPEAGLGPRADALAAAAPDAVVHLAGESLRARRWTAAKKASIRASRVQGMRLLCKALAGLPRHPRVLVSASGIGVYGSRGDEVLTEASAPGGGFLASVCQALEAESAAAAGAGIRAVNLRLGLILSASGGALGMMLPPFRMGLGGPFGDGRQYMSWITLEDVTACIEHCLREDSLSGPVNAVVPHAVSNRAFVHALGRVLHRPAALPLPAALLRLIMGELADELLLASQRTVPERLLASGFVFLRPELEPALRALLG